MKEENKSNIQVSLLLIFFAIILFLLSYIMEPSKSPPKYLLVLSTMVFGIAISPAVSILKDYMEERSTYRPFNCRVREVDRKKRLPIFIAMNVGGCITPPHRTEIDLRKIQRLRCYCEYVKKKQKFPPLVIYTGRSQGYVEFLAQSLGMVENSIDLPLVIENGSALYYPVSKKTIPITGSNSNQDDLIQKVRRILAAELDKNEFEPKVGMITINPKGQETISDLYDKVSKKMSEKCGKEVFKELSIHTTASAVDITPHGIDKISGLKETLSVYHRLRPESMDKGFKDVVAIVNDTSGIDIINEVCNAYCSNQNAPPEVKQAIERNFGKDHIIESDQIDFVMKVIEIETGLQVV